MVWNVRKYTFECFGFFNPLFCFFGDWDRYIICLRSRNSSGSLWIGIPGSYVDSYNHHFTSFFFKDLLYICLISLYTRTFRRNFADVVFFLQNQVFSTAMGVVGLAAPLIVPSVRQSMGYPTDNYYGLKSRCGELDYSISSSKAGGASNDNSIVHEDAFQAVPGEWIKTIGSGRAVKKDL